MTTTVGDQPKTKFTLTPRQKKMWPILILGIFFEGFDDACINIVLPFISKDFQLTSQMAGYALSVIAIGTMFAFFIVRMADNIGRRPIFLWSVYLYSICSLLSAFAPNMYVLVALQFLARIFLIGCWSVGYVIISEEFSTEHRGRAVGLFQLTAVFGALLLALLLPVVNSLGLNWRAFYVIGALPLIPALIFNKNLPETLRFLKLQEEKKAGIKQPKTDFFAVWRHPYTKYVVIMSLVWVFLYFGIKGSLNFFTLRMVKELSWTPNMISLALVTQTAMSLLIIGFNGRLMDKIGRKRAALLIITLGSISAALVFTLKDFTAILIVGLFSAGFVNSFLIVASTLTNELFPTELRSNAMAWTNNIMGRMGQVMVPTLVGTMTLWMGLGQAVTIAVLMPFIALVLIMVFLPETSTLARQADLQEAKQGASQ